MNSLLVCQPSSYSSEWLEADGLGGFASGSATGIRTRRYHALLLTAQSPPTGRVVLVNGFDAWVETANGKFMLSSQIYAPGVLGGDGAQRIEAFDWNPWPHWIYRLEDGTRIECEMFAVKGQPLTGLSWRLPGPKREAKLFVRPFLSGRDYHSLHKANPAFRFDADVKGERVSWQPYPDVPGVLALSNGQYEHQPVWYYSFLYEAERARGLDCEEDLAAPGIFSWNLAENKATLVFTTKENAARQLAETSKAEQIFDRMREKEQRRRETFRSHLHAAADAYIVQRKDGKTIVAGYPWFTDWGRDTFIAVRGLCLATGWFDDARDILLAWASAVSEGMLPNRFPDHGEQPEFNAVDASLWYIVAVHEYLNATKVNAAEKRTLLAAMGSILEGYRRGTRFNIRLDEDGLLAAGQPGVQLTWMDAKVGDWVVTPRIGKPVEVQALWLNALAIASHYLEGWQGLFNLGLDSFRARFWNHERHCLYDVVDVDHRAGETNGSLRPNQIFAVGGLPVQLLDDEQARLVVEAVEDRLLTPLGLRSLAPGEPGYAPRYEGGVLQRDGAYHQGTVWPWLMGPFVEAWVRVRGNTETAKREARERFLAPLLRHLEEAGLGHISEIANAEPPHTPCGCPFQAWSVGEALRLDRVVLAEDSKRRSNGRKPKGKRQDTVAA